MHLDFPFPILLFFLGPTSPKSELKLCCALPCIFQHAPLRSRGHPKYPFTHLYFSRCLHFCKKLIFLCVACSKKRKLVHRWQNGRHQRRSKANNTRSQYRFPYNLNSSGHTSLRGSKSQASLLGSRRLDHLSGPGTWSKDLLGLFSDIH